MDIRKYFGSPTSSNCVQNKKKSSKTCKKNPVVYDSDEDPLPTKIRKKPSKLAVLASDSDSDENNTAMHSKKKRKVSESSPKKRSPKKPKKSDISGKVPSVSSFFDSSPAKKSSIKPTTVDNFFGSAPISQSKVKPGSNKKIIKSNLKRSEAHDDDDFETTLKQIDETGSTPKQSKLNPKTNKANGDAIRVSPKKETEPTYKVKVKSSRNEEEKSIRTDVVSKLSKKAKSFKNEAEKLSITEPTSSSSSADTKKTPVKPKTPVKTKLQNTSDAKDKVEISDEKENSEKKRRNFMNYQKFLHREGPKAHGSKEIPVGAENCFEGITFVITGVLESMERDEAKSLIERYGGKVTTNVSKNTKYLLAGEDAGPSKLEKAEKLGTKQIDENGLLELVKTLPGKKSKYEHEESSKLGKHKKGSRESDNVKNKVAKLDNAMKLDESSKKIKCSDLSAGASTTDKSIVNMWVDKYKPQTIKQIIGQHGEKSNANKLLLWLKNWHRNCSNSGKSKINYAAKFKDPTGASYKAALLSGSPGVGKTTTAHVVCKEAGFSFVEMNASDTRSKKSLEQHVSSLTTNTAMNKYFGEKEGTSLKHALIMDEVDGMAGNEDRGGIQELIQLIKSSKIPVICICNDKSLPKMRSLLNYCFDLAFQRPRVEQIKGAMMSVAFKESLKIAPPALQEIIVGANQDIRQVLHNLSMWSANGKAITYDQAKLEAKAVQKHVHMGPFDVLRKVFSGGDDIKTINDKSDLFFHDYSIASLFVQENYLQVKPRKAKNNIKHLELISAAADSLCNGDLVERIIRSENRWGILPLQAMYSSVIPGEYLNGHLTGMINFPSWLGKNSSRNKIDRLMQELQQHTQLHVSANKTELGLDYGNHLKNRILQPLLQKEADGVRDAVDVMEAYSLLREDLDSLLDICTWSNAPNLFSSLNPKVKAAFTRTYNKEAVAKPYVIKAMGKRAKGAPSLDELPNGNDEVDNLSEEDENANNDAMIKVKVSKSSSSTNKKSTSGNSKKSKGKKK